MVFATVAAFDVFGVAATFDGRPLAVHPARVSAFPMNQVWAGYQRPIEQTKMADFVSFDMARPGVLRIVPSEDENRGEPIILPLSWKPHTKRAGAPLEIRVDKPRQFTVSFGKEGKVLHVFANPPYNEPHVKDEIVFGPGEHHVGVLVPKSGQTIRIEEGAVVYGAILVAHAKNVTVTGRGIVDCSYMDRADRESAAYKAAVKAGLPKGFYGADMAVTAFTCAWSTNVVVRGVTFRDPPRWTMIVRAQSRNVTIENVKIVGCWRYNSDGINVCASENVVIRDSFVRAFDDCIIARGAYLDCGEGATRNVTVERCVLWCDWGKCLEVWAGHKPCLIENIHYRDIACIASDRVACDVTTWFGSSSTRIRNVTMEDIEIDFAYPRWQSHLQRSREDTVFRALPSSSACLVCVDVQSYGRYLGNQKHEPAKDLSGYRVEYESLAFRRFKVFGDVPRLTGVVDATTSPHSIKGLEIEDMPRALSAKVVGDVTVAGETKEQDDATKMGAEMMNPHSAMRTVERMGGGSFKVLIYGNSIAIHGPKADIGWTNCWGMAASAPEKDFAHLVVKGLEKRLGKRADFRIRNLALLERNFATNVASVAEIAADAAWRPDYVVIAIGENSPNITPTNAAVFRKFLGDLSRMFTSRRAKVVLRSPFWKSPAKNRCTKLAAEDSGAVYVDAGSLGASAENKAIGLFAHDGVANHPGDLGMRRLAELILAGFEKVK